MKEKNTKSRNAIANSSGISIANIVTMVGLAILVFFLYLGFTYSGTNMGTSILYAVLISAGIGMLIYFLLKAKSVDTDFKKWRIVEYALVGVFGVACLVTIPVMSHFINVNSDSATLKNYALNDLDNLENAITSFQDQERANLSQMATNLNMVVNATNQHSYMSDDLKSFISEEILGGNEQKLTANDVEAFTNKWNGHIDNVYHYGEGKSYGESFKQAIQQNRDRINSWKVMEIPQAIDEISKLHADLGNQLNSISSSYPLHQLGISGSQMDIQKRHNPFEVTTAATFKEECAKRSGWNVIGVALSIVIFLLIVFNYLVAYRSTKVSIRPGSLSFDGGQVLKP